MKPIPAEKLRWKCDKALFEFDSAWFVAEPFFGQDRAVEALAFGLQSGSNMYVPGQGEEFIQEFLVYCKEKVKPKPLFDWVYVHDFERPEVPMAIALPKGTGKEFVASMDELFTLITTKFSNHFGSAEYAAAEKQLRAEYETYSAEKIDEATQYVEAEGCSLNRTGSGLTVTGDKADALQYHVNELLGLVRDKEQVVQAKLDVLKMKHATKVITAWMKELRVAYPQLVSYFDAFAGDLVSHIDALVLPGQCLDFLNAYKVNLFVDNSTVDVPVIYERNPTYANLFGSINHVFLQGGIPATDLTLIKPGSLHRANGGVLVLNVYDLLTSAHSWQYLIRGMQAKEIKLSDVMEPFRTTHFSIPDPALIPMDITIVLVGPESIFALLAEKEREFHTLFPVHVAFDKLLDNTAKNVVDAGLLLSKYGDFTSEAITLCLEYAVIKATTQTKINVSALRQLLPEILHYASGRIEGEHVRKAITAMELRNNQVKCEIEKRMLNNDTLIETEGESVGQINALAVASVPDYSFGTILRVTANVYAGSGEVVNIEREVKNSGTSYDKGVFILTSYLKSRFAKTKAMSFGASICMEQHAGGIDGDSASSTELYALLSAMSDIPINQGIAVTGSVNQKGEVQVIGGVNYKIEAFFDLCKKRGFTGRQGVMIPEANEKDLMLKDEVADAVLRGQFHIWSVKNVDEGFELLTGKDRWYVDNEVKKQMKVREKK